jgi:hypothetical protein
MNETDERRAPFDDGGQFRQWWARHEYAMGGEPRSAIAVYAWQAGWQAARAAAPVSTEGALQGISSENSHSAGATVRVRGEHERGVAPSDAGGSVQHSPQSAPSPVAAPPAGQMIRVEDSNGRIRVHVGDVEYVPLDAVPGWTEIAAAPVPPSAWVSVPREPTMAMYDGWVAASKDARNNDGVFGTWVASYRAMIAAASLPSAPQETER